MRLLNRAGFCMRHITCRAKSSSSGDMPQLGPKSSQALRVGHIYGLDGFQTYQSNDPDMLETVKFEDLPRAQQRFVKQFEKINEDRIKEIFKKNYKNIIGFILLTSLVAGIYWYTIYAVKQETFLEEIDEEMAQEHPKTHGHLAAKKSSA